MIFTFFSHLKEARKKKKSEINLLKKYTIQTT